MILLKDTNNVQSKIRRVHPGQSRTSFNQLRFNQGKFFEQSNAPIKETLDVESLSCKVKQEGDVVGDGKVDGGGGGVEGADHLNDGVATKTCHIMLIKI